MRAANPYRTQREACSESKMSRKHSKCLLVSRTCFMLCRMCLARFIIFTRSSITGLSRCVTKAADNEVRSQEKEPVL